MRCIALNDGASFGVSDIALSFSTCSSEGTAILRITAIATHPRMIGTESRWIIRATNDGFWGGGGLIMLPSPGRR